MELPKIEKSFKYWEQSELQRYIGLSEQEQLEPLQSWLNNSCEITAAEMSILKELHIDAKRNITFWNEMELRHRFVGPLTRLVKFDNYEKRINYFAERTFSIITQNKVLKAKLYGTVDWLVATGTQKPEHPFFFIHEYKAEEGKTLDGRGQLLAAMYTAQQLNQEPPMPTIFQPNPIHFYKDIPIYGAYVTGRYWYFLALQETNYGISKPYISTEMDDLQAIFKILKAQKQLIYSYLEK